MPKAQSNNNKPNQSAGRDRPAEDRDRSIRRPPGGADLGHWQDDLFAPFWLRSPWRFVVLPADAKPSEDLKLSTASDASL